MVSHPPDAPASLSRTSDGSLPTPVAVKRPVGTWVVALMILVLVVLHQDLWNWDNDKLVFGFLPVTLAYHASISIAASVVWFIATIIAWPVDTSEAGYGLATASESTGGSR